MDQWDRPTGPRVCAADVWQWFGSGSKTMVWLSRSTSKQFGAIFVLLLLLACGKVFRSCGDCEVLVFSYPKVQVAYLKFIP